MTNQKGYSQKNIQVGNTVWSIVFAPTYISIRKETNNPFMSTGKQFANINEAIDNYKSMRMKTALMQLI